MNSRRTGVFTVDERNRIRDRILEIANSDERIVAGAVVGSLATGEGDRWSDLDLAFGVIPENQALDVLDRLTAPLVKEFSAVPLFDLPYRESIFRVLLLQGCLQVDLSVTPASSFGPIGPNFRILFGNYTENPPIPAPPAGQLLGYAAHHAARARFCIERGRFWQAEYWISGARDYTLSLGTPLVREFSAVPLFDLPHRESIFRVFLLQGCLQVDLSVTPASSFGPNGPKFKMLFGDYKENPAIPAPPAGQLLGYAAHHAARARFCIERGRFWQGGISSAVAMTLSALLACSATFPLTTEGALTGCLPKFSYKRSKPWLSLWIAPNSCALWRASSMDCCMQRARSAGDPAEVEPHLLVLRFQWHE